MGEDRIDTIARNLANRIAGDAHGLPSLSYSIIAAALREEIAAEREACAALARKHGHEGRADERINDYEQGGRDTADMLASMISRGAHHV